MFLGYIFVYSDVFMLQFKICINIGFYFCTGFEVVKLYTSIIRNILGFTLFKKL